MKIGDRVTHTIFPPVTGEIFSIIDNNMVIVNRDDSGTLFYDTINTWALIDQGTDKTISDTSDEEDENIIDVDYREI